MVNVIIDVGPITDVGAGSSGARAVLVGSIVAVAMMVAVGLAELRGSAAVDGVAVAGGTTISVASVPSSRSSGEPEAHAAKPAAISSRIVRARIRPVPLTKHRAYARTRRCCFRRALARRFNTKTTTTPTAIAAETIRIVRCWKLRPSICA